MTALQIDMETGACPSKTKCISACTFVHMSERNWLWTFNRRLRKYGWDLGTYPKKFFIFELHAEFLRIFSDDFNSSDALDLAILAEGYSQIFKRNGHLHSQLGQEAFVLGLTHGAIGKTYLELGAFDPYVLSNTATLRDSFGWTGLSYDPNPEAFAKFKLANLEDSFRNVGVAGFDSEAILYRDSALSYTTIVPNNEVTDSDRVKLIGIRNIVREFETIDYLSIDIEGGETEVLSQFPFDLVKPFVITIEHNFRDPDKQLIVQLLKDRGYREFLPSRTDFESWFVLEEYESKRISRL